MVRGRCTNVVRERILGVSLTWISRRILLRNRRIRRRVWKLPIRRPYRSILIAVVKVRRIPLFRRKRNVGRSLLKLRNGDLQIRLPLAFTKSCRRLTKRLIVLLCPAHCRWSLTWRGSWNWKVAIKIRLFRPLMALKGRLSLVIRSIPSTS